MVFKLILNVSSSNRYFDFHSAPESGVGMVTPLTHGVVPVWGFGTVVASTCREICGGDRVYGYLAPARYVLLPVDANAITKYAFYVPRPHLPAGEFCFRVPSPGPSSSMKCWPGIVTLSADAYRRSQAVQSDYPLLE